jgi:hypothetical protein
MGGLALVCLLTLATSTFADVLAQSRFDADSEGWVAKDLAYPNPGAPPAPIATYTPSYHATGGNPGGFLSMTDPTGNAWYWYAPAKFLGNKATAYGGSLSFDLAVTGSGAPFDEEDVILVGGGLTLVTTLPARPGTTFTSYRVDLTEAGWKRDSPTGTPATASDMTTALGALTAIYIRGEFLLAMDDVGSIDNIVLEGSGAICDIQLNTTTAVNGDQVIAQVVRLGNANTTSLPVELKLWIDIPGAAPVSFLRIGADGSVAFPAGLNVNIGPIPLFTISAGFPRGTYAFSCRMLDPVTGALLREDLNLFGVQ